MTIVDALNYIQTTALSHFISKSNHLLIATFQVFHVIGFILLLAALVLITLRSLNVALKQYAVADVAKQALQLAWAGLAVTLTSGVLMFIGSPKHYAYNPAFEVKMVLLAVAIIAQTVLFQKITTPRLALSLGLWFTVSMAGRAIGFV